MEINFKSWNKVNGKTSICRIYIEVDGETNDYVEMRSVIGSREENEYNFEVDELLYDALTDIMIEDWERLYHERDEYDEHAIWEMFKWATIRAFPKNSWTDEFYNEYKNGIEIEL